MKSLQNALYFVYANASLHSYGEGIPLGSADRW